MKFIDKIREKLSSLVRALSRYPLTVAFLVAAAGVVIGHFSKSGGLDSPRMNRLKG